MNPIVLQKIDPAAGHLKFYRLTLIEGPEACRIHHQWGRIGYPARESYTTCPDRIAAEKLLLKTLTAKQKSGYFDSGLSNVPETYQEQSCPSCGILRANAATLAGRSAVKVHEGYLEVIFRDHVPFWALDVASQAKFMGEIRGLIKQYPAAPDLVFPAQGHATAHLLGKVPPLILAPKEKAPERAPGAGQLSWID